MTEKEMLEFVSHDEPLRMLRGGDSKLLLIVVWERAGGNFG